MKRRERNPNPLILCGHGASLRIDGGSLLVRNGFTHHPQSQEIWRFFRGSLDLPTRIIIVDGSGTLSFDVLSWLGEQNVSLIRIDWRGKVAMAMAGYGFAADKEKVAWQIATRANEAKRVAFSTELMRQKIAAGIATIEQALPASKRRDLVVLKLRGDLQQLVTTPRDVKVLRGIEARAGAAYFSAWHGTPLRWGASRHSIPDEWREIGPRSALRVGKIAKNERATHPLNALLNYGYAVLQSRLQIDAVAQGYDPTLGIMHHSYQGSPAYIFDLMEPERAEIDRCVLALALTERLSRADFILTPDGTCRVAPSLARFLVQRIASLLDTVDTAGRIQRNGDGYPITSVRGAA